MPKIKIADLNKKIEVTDWAQSPNEKGGTNNSRIPLFETWAKVENASNPYRLNGFRVNTADREKATHIFTIRERCDYEIGPKNWIFYSYRGRDEWYKVLGTSDVEDGFNHYTRLLAALWVRDSDRLDAETQDIPCENIEPDGGYDFRDVGF